MNKKYECGIILDLLPLYIEGMVSSETEEVINQHLLECEACKKAYEEMSQDIDICIEKREQPKRHKFKKKSRVRILLYAYLLLLLSIVAFCLTDIYVFYAG